MTPARAGRESTPKRVDAFTWLLVGLVLLPLLVEAVHALVKSQGYTATTDNALNEMIVRDVGRHTRSSAPTLASIGLTRDRCSST